MADAPQPGIDPRILSLERDVSQPGRLTLQRDMFASVVVAQLIHETSVRFKNPLRGNSRPIGIRAGNSRERVSQSGVGALGPLKRLDQANTDQASKGLPIESLDWDFAGDEIEIYAKFAPPQGCVRLSRTATQSIPDNTDTAINWTVQNYVSGANITHSTTSNPNRITFAKRGVVQIDYSISMAAATIPLAFLTSDGNLSNRFGGVSGMAGNVFWAAGGCPITINAAGQYVECLVYHNSGGAVDLNGPSTHYSRLFAKYIAPPASYTADVTLVIEGG